LTFAGANCPGEIQTVLNQMIIPITMIGAAFFLKAKFESFQIWGSVFILLGAIVASSGYLFSSKGEDPSDGSAHSESAEGTAVTPTSVATATASAAIVLYFISVIPSALSNIYKEDKMKEQDMNEVHTSTIVAFWQLWFGFLFLPLMSLPSLGKVLHNKMNVYISILLSVHMVARMYDRPCVQQGQCGRVLFGTCSLLVLAGGLTYQEMSMQLSDGFTCFLGTNPNDPQGDCSHAAYLLLAYIVVNFFYNILMLAITKRGSAVLLVISQVCVTLYVAFPVILGLFLHKWHMHEV
jgi:drug/metabolite transporter (DMT)-like permease